MRRIAQGEYGPDDMRIREPELAQQRARDKSLLYSLFPFRIDRSARDESNLARILFLIIGANSDQ